VNDVNDVNPHGSAASDAPAGPALLTRLPPAGTTDSGVILNAFLETVTDKGLELYPAQEEALLELLEGRHVVLSTPTGSGKSLVALGLHFKAMSEGAVSVYTAPIKALVSEKFFALCEDFGAPYVGMMTGDATINRDAPILCCTAEILAKLALEGETGRITSVVMDEFHYYGDKERGMAWQVPLLAMPHAQFLLMSATLGDMSTIVAALQRRTGREVKEVTSSERPVPLDFEYRETPLHETLEELVNSHRAPVYMVHFTQREAAEQAQALMSVNFTSKEVKERIARALQGVRFDTPYGKDVQKYLRHGLGLHHAGLLPKYRLLVEQLAQQGLLKVICGTDTLGVGVNIPIRTVLFTKLAKFDGEHTGILSARDFKQIAGRAGRKGFDDRGSVVCQAPEHIIENKRAEQRFQSGETKKKPAKKQPEQGFVGWDKNTFDRLVEKPPEPLSSRFQITHGVMMSLLQGPARPAEEAAPHDNRHNGYRALVELVALSHESELAKKKHLQRARVLFQALRNAELVLVEPRPASEGPGQRVRIAGELQNDFSLNQALSLYLVETLFLLDPASEGYPLDVTTLVESILENPKQILFKQQDKARNALYAELKAQGTEYDELKEKLDEVTWPKPLADFIYTTFNEFAKRHPWVADSQQPIRPKSIARDLLERYATFNEYIKEYGLERSEGLLLRYVSDFYKTLVQTVPEARKDDALLDVEATFRALIARVDSSLVDEWESLLGARADKPVSDELVKTHGHLPPPPLDQNMRSFVARVRAELHRLVQALARAEWDEAAALLRRPASTEGPSPGAAPEDGAERWDGRRLEQALAPFYAEHERLVSSSQARQPGLTLVDKLGDRRYRVRQVLVDEAGDNDFFLEGEVDLTNRKDASEPLVELLQIGR
jgi:superfamily II RNA helicase